MTDPPYVSDVPRTQAQIARDGFIKGAPGIVQGGQQSRPVRAVTTVTPRPATAGAPPDRLSLNWTATGVGLSVLSGTSYTIPSWPTTFDSDGNSVGLNPAGDDGGAYLFLPGRYAATVILQVAGAPSAATSFWMIASMMVYDTPGDSGEPHDAFVPGGVGGAASLSPAASCTFYANGIGTGSGGGIFVSLRYPAGLDPAVTQVWVELNVLRIG